MIVAERGKSDFPEMDFVRSVELGSFSKAAVGEPKVSIVWATHQ
jgi:hypothetical protein